MRTRAVVAFALLSVSAAAIPGDPSAAGLTTPPAVDPGTAAAAAALANAGAAPASVMPQAPADLERLLADLDREERNLKKRVSDLGTEAALVHARTVARGRSYVRMAKAGLLPIGGGFDGLVDHAAKLERLRRALARDLRRDGEIKKERGELDRRLDDVRLRRGPIEAQQRQLSRNKAALMAAVDRELAFQRAFTSTEPGASAVYGSGVGPLDPSAAAVGFAAQKGRLPFPLAGRAEIRSVRRPGADGPGLEMTAPRGSVVRAVYAGRVAFADSYAEYGNTVIVEHGSSYYTVSASLGEIAVAVGDDVAAGTRVGTVGRDGALYVEVRVGTETVDPAEWFGL